MIHRFLSALALGCAGIGTLPAASPRVPADHPSSQAAIDAARDGDVLGFENGRAVVRGR